MQTIHEIDQEKTCLSQDPSPPEEHVDASQRHKKAGNVATSPNQQFLERRAAAKMNSPRKTLTK
jgi:hypothetical protein